MDPGDDCRVHMARNMRQARRERRVTQAEFARMCGLPRPTVANLESGTANPTLSVLVKVAATIGVTLDYLLSDQGVAATIDVRSTPEADGLVYFVQAQSRSRVKIGKTKSLPTRLGHFRRDSGSDPKVLLLLQGYSQLEAELHRRFKDHRIQGEWFQMADEIVRFIDEHASHSIAYVPAMGASMPRIAKVPGARAKIAAGERLAAAQSDLFGEEA